jgi:HlyD family secretion protein
MPFRLSPATIIPVLVTVTAVFLFMPQREEPAGVFQGYVEGEYVYVGAGAGGRLERLPVRRGDHVLAGDVLFALEEGQEGPAVREAEHNVRNALEKLEDLKKGQRPSELRAIEARLRQADAARELAGDVLTRRDALFKEGTISREELDRARTQLDETAAKVRQIRAELATARMGGREDAIRAAQAQAQAAQARLQQVRWQLDEKIQRAPAAAVVHDTLYRTGEWVPAGTPVVTLLPPQNIKVRFFVPQPLAGRIRTGDKAVVHVDGGGAPVTMCVSYIADNAEYTPPVIYSSRQRAKLVFMMEASACAAPAAATPDRTPQHLPAVQDHPAALHPGQPVDVLIPSLRTGPAQSQGSASRQE